MREKLIQILVTKESLEYSYSSGNEPVVADDILSELRCDKCKHWGAEKIRLDIMADFRDFAPCNRGIGQWALSETPAEFFCALWEAK